MSRAPARPRPCPHPCCQGPLAAVILAAGKSTRLPRFKPLLSLGGQSLVARAASLFRQAGITDIVVVTGARAGDVGAEVSALGLRAVCNADFEDGMFSSVRAGLAALPQGLAGVLVLPVDIPLIRPSTLRLLAERFRLSAAEALLPGFCGEPGHPPLLAAQAIPKVLAWSGEGGLAGALATLECELLPVADAQILFDVDHEASFAEAEARLPRLARASPREALALLEIHKAGARGLAHGRSVAEVALALARALNAGGEGGAGLDLELLEAAALLHDIAKGQPQHEEAGARLLADLGLTRTAEIVAAHRDIDPATVAQPTERELVYLADKLVRGPQRVSIARRFQEKLDRFAGDAEAVAAIRRRLEHAQGMQALLERRLGQDLEELLRPVVLPGC
ncbi:MAG: nucleotidyltransferase family protein [Humidesulfovibrio sp.]|nr:nucleotidyltransferase family protein [Humidesulfovibrio sp.]